MIQVSSARLNIVRGALLVNIILTLFFGVGAIFFPQQMMESFMPNEPFTGALQLFAVELGALNLGWVVAMAMAVRDPLRNRSLMQAIIAYMVIFLLGEAYLFIAPPVALPATIWIGTVLLLILAVMIGVAYPWRVATT